MNRALVSSVLLAVSALPVHAQEVTLGANATAVFAPGAPERKLRLAALTAKREEVNRKDRTAWAKITTRDEWEKYRDARLGLLRLSLGRFPEPPAKVAQLVTKMMEGDGF